MKVLYVVRYWPTLTETFVYREIAGLQARGVEVSVVALGGRADGALQDELPKIRLLRPPSGLRGVQLVRSARYLATSRGREAWRGLGGLRTKDALRALWLADVARGFDRLHVHFAGEAAEWARAAAALARRPYSVTVHAVDLFKPRASLGDVLRDADVVVTVAEHHRERLRSYGVEAVVVRCGVDPARYPAASPGGDGLRIVAVGRFVAKKGFDRLVAAVRDVPEATLRLVSDAPTLGERVEVGPLPPSQVPLVLAGAQLFALPCRIADDGDADGLPVAIVEAMAAGLPVVTTPVAGIPELVDDAVGWLVPVDDADALREALREAARRPEERVARGTRGRARVVERGFTVERQVDGLLSAWK